MKITTLMDHISYCKSASGTTGIDGPGEHLSETLAAMIRRNSNKVTTITDAEPSRESILSWNARGIEKAHVLGGGSNFCPNVSVGVPTSVQLSRLGFQRLSKKPLMDYSQVEMLILTPESVKFVRFLKLIFIETSHF